MTRYYAETECEHGNVKCSVFGEPNDRGIMTACPGGVRRELTIDYSAAAKALYDSRPEVTSGRWPHWQDLRSAGRSLYLTNARAAVLAALGDPEPAAIPEDSS